MDMTVLARGCGAAAVWPWKSVAGALMAAVAIGLLGCLPARGAVHGENLAMNGELGADQTSFPAWWGEDGTWKLLRGEGPGGMNAVGIDTAVSPEGYMRQDHSLKLVAGAKYVVSMRVRTRNFRAARLSYTLYNDGWQNEAGVFCTVPDAPWTRLEAVVVAPRSSGDYGSALVMLGGTSGSIQVADLQIRALEQAVAEASASTLRALESERMVPLCRLHAIPSASPVIAAHWFGVGRRPATAVYRIDGGEWKGAAVDGSGRMELGCEGLAPGCHVLEYGCGKVKGQWRFAVLAPLAPVKTRRLNNFVEKLPSVASVGGGSAGHFLLPRDSWVYVRLPRPDSSLALPSRKAIVGSGAVWLPRGRHEFRLSGPGGTVELRMVPEIYAYQLSAGPYLPGMARNSFARVGQYLLSSICSYEQGEDTLSAGEWTAIRKTNARRYRGTSVSRLLRRHLDAVSLARGIEGSQGLVEDGYDGISMDEFFAGGLTALARCVDAYEILRVPAGRSLNTYLYGRPLPGGITTAFLSQGIQPGGTAGLIKFEAYCHPVKEEDAAERYLENMLVGTAATFQRILPGMVPYLGLVFINSNVPGSLNAAYLPEVDLKYYLDMQFRLAARHPQLKGLGLIGTWGGNYADNEMGRWTAALFRHYAIEGRTDSLARSLGFSYRPGHVANADFAEGLRGWAAEGAVAPGRQPGFGVKMQKRWAAPAGIGDSFAVLSRGKTPNRLGQMLAGMQRGRCYKLQFVTADGEDIMGARKPLRTGQRYLDVELTGCEILEEHTLMWRVPPQGAGVKVNVDQRIFRVRGDEVTFWLTDASMPEGAKTAVNFIQLTPYFEGRPQEHWEE